MNKLACYVWPSRNLLSKLLVWHKTHICTLPKQLNIYGILIGVITIKQSDKSATLQRIKYDRDGAAFNYSQKLKII